MCIGNELNNYDIRNSFNIIWGFLTMGMAWSRDSKSYTWLYVVYRFYAGRI